MTITNAKIEWHDEYDNAPTLYIEVDGFLPTNEEWRYEQRGPHFFAQHESGLCSFLYWDGPSEDGYGGRVFDITMIDGSKRSLKGPWSGNELSMAAAGFPLAYSGRAKARCTWSDGWCESYGIHLIEPLWLDCIARFCPDAHVVKAALPAGSPDLAGEQNMVIDCCGRSGTPKVEAYLIARKGMAFNQSQAYKRAVRLSRYVYAFRQDGGAWAEDSVKRQRDLAIFVNELITEHGLAAHGMTLFDLDSLPPFLPPLPPPTHWNDCDEDGEPFDTSP